MTQYAVCYTLENPPPGAELVCFNRLTGGDTPAETSKIKAAAAAAVKDVAGKAAPPPTAPARRQRPRQHRRRRQRPRQQAAEAMAKWSR